MKEREIGIVLEKVGKNSIKGYLGFFKVTVKIDEDARICVDDQIIKYCFALRTGEKNLLTVAVGVCENYAKKIAQELKNMGYENIVLIYDGVEIPI